MPARHARESERDPNPIERSPGGSSDAPPSVLPSRGVEVVAFPTPLAPLSAVRSTLLMASVRALKESGHFDAYAAALPKDQRAIVLESVAGCWVPAPTAIAHYRACDSLDLTSLEQMAMGRQTGCAIRQHLTRAAGFLSRDVGVSPWFVFEHFNRFWARSFQGGGIAVVKLGPKDAEVIYARCPLLQFTYFRSALRGVALGLLELVTQRVLMNETSFNTSRHEARYRVAWV